VPAMRRPSTGNAALLAAVTWCCSAACASSSESAPDAGMVADAATGSPDAAAPALTIVLSFDGETLVSGTADDPATNSSQLISPGNSPATIPPFDAAVMETAKPRGEVIADITSGVRALFAPFDVVVQTSRPAGRDYVLIVVGGASSDAGAPSGAANLAALDCDNAAGFAAIGLAFTSEANVFSGLAYEARVGRASALIAAAVGNTLGLDLVTDCPDVMASPFLCSMQSFTDSFLTCGVQTPRDCVCGGTTQNSVQKLQQLLASGSS
jgi:hypothetical protein